jgi:hypothetical protein
VNMSARRLVAIVQSSPAAGPCPNRNRPHRPERGSYWSTPSGRIGSLISMVKAQLGDPEQSGEHGDVKL